MPPFPPTLLVLLVCLAGDPTVCRSERTGFEFQNALECAVNAQPAAAAWLEDHPKWTLRSFRCQRAGDRGA